MIGKKDSLKDRHLSTLTGAVVPTLPVLKFPKSQQRFHQIVILLNRHTNS